MKTIIKYIRQYIYALDKRVVILISAFTTLLIYYNYQHNIDNLISQHRSFGYRFSARWLIFFLAFSIPYGVHLLFKKKEYHLTPRFLFLLFIAPALFALKVALNLPFHFSDNTNWNIYWEQVIYWPLLVLIISGLLFLIWRWNEKDSSFYGLTTRNLDFKPYLWMLLIMLPLVALASTQPDFLAVYPKLQLIAEVYKEPGLEWWHKLLFELSYGSDFITIELFFRGFLILAFVKWFGKDAILPMACFYCTIHFGKPLGECISSYFGGILLGIVVYNTRSILGGLIVHVGIAWMMELGGYLGNFLSDK